MNSKQLSERKGFTIVELLTVMSIIVILIGLLVPGLNQVKRYAREVKQNAQFHAIDVAMELFQVEFEGYPDSKTDAADADYPGALRLCEAMVGQDLLGFHPDSRFRADGKEGASGAGDLYKETDWNATEWAENVKARQGVYLQLENANAFELVDIYGSGNTGTLPENRFVLCDVYNRVRHQTTSKKIGMPVLYYKADTSKTVNDDVADRDKNIYNYKDNDILVRLGIPWDISATPREHPMSGNTAGTTLADVPPDLTKFYENIKNKKINVDKGRPFRSDSYILLSAGFDGEYGTRDDIFNFNK